MIQLNNPQASTTAKKERHMSTQEQIDQFKKSKPHWQPEPPLSDQETEELRTEGVLQKSCLSSGNNVSLKVSQKGAVSVYGLGRYPFTLYESQWTKLLANVEKIKRFIAANREQLATRESR
jgi:hypothetical protein